MDRPIFKTNRTCNEELKPLLKIINKDLLLSYKQTLQFKETFDLLGYDLTSENIYAIITQTGWKWITTKEGKYSKKIWNHKEKIYEYIMLDYKLEDHLLKHIFPLELKNKNTKKIKYIKDKEDSLGAYYIDEDMCGSSLKDFSDILFIDIDCHKNNTLQAYQELIVLINYFKEYIFLEKSCEGSFHLFIKLDKNYYMYDKKQFFKNLKEKLNLQCSELPSVARFPFSYHYEACNHEFEIFTPIQSIDIIKNNYNNQTGYILEEQKVKKIVPIVSTIYGRKRQSQIKHITPEEFVNQTDIVISKGNRYFNMLKICRISKFNNWTTDETVAVIRRLDHGSKDLRKWNNNELSINIENIKSKSTMSYIEYITSKPETFISNTHLNPDWLNSTIDTDKFLNRIIFECNYKITKLNKQKFSIILKEMFGAILYDCENNRTVLNNKKEKYLVGKQFSEQYSKLLKLHYIELSKTDVHGIIKSILKDSKLFSQYKSNLRGWYFNARNKEGNFCKQYDLANNKKHYLFKNRNVILYLIIQLLRYFNIIIKKLIIQDIFNNINDKFILNIVDNREFLLDTG